MTLRDVNQSFLIDIDELRVGMFIQLELGWMNHPFPMSSFRITGLDQIHTLRELGLKQVRYVPARSNLPHELAVKPTLDRSPSADKGASSSFAPHVGGEGDVLPETSRRSLGLSRDAEASLDRCSRRHQEAADAYTAICAQVLAIPDQAGRHVQELIGSYVNDLLEAGAGAIRLLVEAPSQRPALHAVNVMVLALLLGKALELPHKDLNDVGVAAYLHDMGKVVLPPHIGEPGARLADADRMRYESHVGHSVELGERMGLASDVLIAIAQHHEMADGSGFPLRLVAEDLGRGGQIVAVVNRYDRMCNPLHGEPPLTPHDALSLLYTQQKQCFDAAVLAAFIRMMGVYPPGSLVQLTDGRYALVVSVEASHPLRPRVLIFTPEVPREDAQVESLATASAVGIRRSLRPDQMPRNVLDYLSPHQRICYFFERAMDAQPCEDSA